MWLNIVEGVAAVVMLGVAVKVIMFGAKQRLDMVIYGEKLLKVMCEQCREMPYWDCKDKILSQLCGVSQVGR